MRKSFPIVFSSSFAIYNTVIAEIFVRVKISYSSVCQLSYAGNFRTATVVSDTLVYAYGFRMLLLFRTSRQKREIYEIKSRTKFCAITVHAKFIVGGISDFGHEAPKV